MTNLERLLEQSKDKNEIKDQMIAVMFETIQSALSEVSLARINQFRCIETLCDSIDKIEQLAAQALGEK
jgi:hypothetical protein